MLLSGQQVVGDDLVSSRATIIQRPGHIPITVIPGHNIVVVVSPNNIDPPPLGVRDTPRGFAHAIKNRKLGDRIFYCNPVVKT
jgi:hypothetical protein